jgi:hypothetical protein
MSDLKEEIARLIQTAEEAAYQRGWDDALAAVLKAAAKPSVSGFQTEESAEPRKTGGRPATNAVRLVETSVSGVPGKRGVDVVKDVQAIDPSIPERTVRTALRRLKLHKRIWQRDGRWYPKAPRPRSLLENDDEEATSSPPHQ